MSGDELEPGAAETVYKLGYDAGYRAGWDARERVETAGGWIPTEREVRNSRTDFCRPYGLRGRPMFGEHLGRKR